MKGHGVLGGSDTKLKGCREGQRHDWTKGCREG